MSRHRTNVAYNRLTSERTKRDETDGFVDEQFVETKKKPFPWKTIAFIIIFMIGGIVCLTFGIMISTGRIDKKYEDRAWPLLILGILMFLPGGYFGYILLCICLRRDGFTWDEIPIF